MQPRGQPVSPATPLSALVTRRALARETHLARRTVDRIIAEQGVPVVRPGARWDYLKRDDFERALAAYSRDLPRAQPATSRTRPADSIAARVSAARAKRAARAKPVEPKRPIRKTRGPSKARDGRGRDVKDRNRAR